MTPLGFVVERVFGSKDTGTDAGRPAEKLHPFFLGLQRLAKEINYFGDMNIDVLMHDVVVMLDC